MFHLYSVKLVIVNAFGQVFPDVFSIRARSAEEAIIQAARCLLGDESVDAIEVRLVK